MKASITSIGTAVPSNKLDQMQTAQLVSERIELNTEQKRLLKAVYKATGIHTRYSVINTERYLSAFSNTPNTVFPSTAARMQIYKEHALPLAINAIKHCLHEAPQTITHLITVSCTGMYAPGIDIEIIQELKLNTNIKRTAIHFMGCYAAFNAMKIADDICKANLDAKVLIVCVELCTIHFQNNANLDNLISNAIFSDGAAALLIEAQTNTKKKLNVETFHCDLIPQTSQDMAWQIGDSGFDIVLKSYVPEIIESGIANFTKNLLKDHAGKIDLYAIHPGGVKILHACESALNITKEDNKHSYQVLQEYGNMSSATVLFVLKNIWDNIKNNDHDKTIFSCAFGPGLTLESMLMKVHHE